MNILMKAATIAAALAVTSQPCLAAAVEGQSPPLATTVAVSATERVDFNLHTHVSSNAGQSGAGALALTTAAAIAQETAADQEREERKRRGMSKGVKTGLIVGGVAVVALIALGAYAMRNGPLGKGPVFGPSQ